MAELITFEIQAEASGQIDAPRADIWLAVADLARRPHLTSVEALAGTWPEETARVRTVMNKGDFRMARTETVIRCVPEERLLVKIEAPEFGSSAWLDHRIDQTADGWCLTLSVIAIATFPEGAGPNSREEYAALTLNGLEDAVGMYRERIEAAARGNGNGE